jgi:hypothetical protein
MVDGEIVRPWGRTVSYAQSLNLSTSRPPILRRRRPTYFLSVTKHVGLCLKRSQALPGSFPLQTFNFQLAPLGSTHLHLGGGWLHGVANGDLLSQGLAQGIK